MYKRPDDVDVDADEIVLNNSGHPVVMRGKPGRKPKTKLNPVTPQLLEVSKAREEHIDTDSILHETARNPEGETALDIVIRGLAEEAAFLEFERMEAERQGKDPTHISVKRARVLKSMADLMIKRKAALDGGIDLDSPGFEALFGFILETFKGAMQEAGCRKEVIEVTFSNLGKAIDGHVWKEDARRKIKEKKA